MADFGEKLLEKALDPIMDLLKKVAGPAAEEIGLTLQDSVRLYRRKRQFRLLEKFGEFVERRGLEPEPIKPKVLLRGLDYGSIEDDDELQDRFAALLANATDPATSHDMTLAFLEILNQLTPVDVKFMDVLFNYVCERYHASYPPESKTANSIQGVEISIDELQNIYDSLFESDVKTAYLTHDTPHYDKVVVKLSDSAVIFRNCMRLGLMDRIMKPRKDSGRYASDRIPQDTYFFLTALGYEFVRACRTPEDKENIRE